MKRIVSQSHLHVHSPSRPPPLTPPPGDYRCERRPVPEVGREEVLIRVLAVGVCASDTKCFAGAPYYWGVCVCACVCCLAKWSCYSDLLCIVPASEFACVCSLFQPQNLHVSKLPMTSGIVSTCEIVYVTVLNSLKLSPPPPSSVQAVRSGHATCSLP